eukprot:SAG11_NODE_25100_length_363_cov_3.469697_2_plen_53_part_01
MILNGATTRTRSDTQGLLLSDMPTEVVHRIGDFLKPKENGRLGIALGKSKVAT